MRVTELREFSTTKAMSNGAAPLYVPITLSVAGQILDTVTVEAANK